MKCPYCFREIPFSTVCPACGRALHFGGNTQFLAEVQQGRLGVKDIFAQTLKRHKKGDAFRSLTRRPALTAEMLETWQRPWMFLRLFVMLLIATVLLTSRRRRWCIFHLNSRWSLISRCLSLPTLSAVR